MYHPSLDGASSDCWYPNVGSLNVHYSSGVANHFFYLLAEGTNPEGGPTSPTCQGGDTRVASGSADLTGIGRNAAELIWYRALTVYFTSNTNYAGARVATLNAAADLFPEDPSVYNAVAAAWSAVNVN
jgi:zinc metalloprotease ZmpA